jgi:DNA-directed RNA polymerase II subunit RPB1
MAEVSPWMIRIVLDRKKKEDKGLNNKMICAMIEQAAGGDIKALHNNDNAPTLVIQVRIKDDSRSKAAANGQGDEQAEDSYDDDQFVKQVCGRLPRPACLTPPSRRSRPRC